MRRPLFALVCLTLTGCGGENPSGSSTSPSATTSSVTVSVPSPVRMGQTAQATGTESLSNGQSQPVTTGWQSDAPAVASVTNAGLVTGVSNGRATIFVLAGGRQGQQVVRVVPDYHGQWSGGLRVTSCTESGVFAEFDFCDDFPVGFTSGYAVGLAQSGELMTASVTYGSLAFPSVAAPVREDGSSAFTATTSITDSGITLTIDAGFVVNSTQVGAMSGTVTEVWRFPNVAGEGRLVQDIVSTSRTSATALQSLADSGTKKLRVLRKLTQR